MAGARTHLISVEYNGRGRLFLKDMGDGSFLLVRNRDGQSIEIALKPEDASLIAGIISGSVVP